MLSFSTLDAFFLFIVCLNFYITIEVEVDFSLYIHNCIQTNERKKKFNFRRKRTQFMRNTLASGHV